MYPEELLGIGNYVGEIREGPDGNLYQWEVGFDGLGNPVGFWKIIKRVGRAIGKGVRAVGRGIRKVARLPVVRQLLPAAAAMIPGIGPAAAAGVTAAQRAGLLGLGEGDYIGQLREDSFGNLYQWEEGVDGLGTPMGFWKLIRSVGKGIRRAASLPMVREMLPPPVRTGLRMARQAGIMGMEDYY